MGHCSLLSGTWNTTLLCHLGKGYVLWRLKLVGAKIGGHKIKKENLAENFKKLKSKFTLILDLRNRTLNNPAMDALLCRLAVRVWWLDHMKTLREANESLDSQTPVLLSGKTGYLYLYRGRKNKQSSFPWRKPPKLTQL